MIDWKRVPWSLWLFCAALLTGLIMREVDTHGTVVVKVFFAALIFAWIYYLLKAVEWLWVLTIAISVLALVPSAFIGPFDWLGAVQSLIELALLLLPMTRRFFAYGGATAGASGG